ncbi:ABC transporter ATP-binding protein [Macrococcus sp. DPC7161]|uniref:ABC transporter ATP-binding protein n=1 Tax=Macrococcus sp. DPC7161 TaxID=2507060 RepID=UPI00100C3379|nr:ABC transporter ATP-binding protein [Macrococcus sp. DPC7161]RXK18442.1 ABC transporter ATP-binding protein [Macrococcus sp. DPC7161]
MLSVKNLRLKYPGTKTKIFDGLNIEIQDKQKVLLLGPSGSGKSTLLNVLSGITPDLIDLPMKYDALEVRKDCGVIFQNPDSQFCMPKVYEELAFILENRNINRNEMDYLIHEALQKVGLQVDKDQKINQLSGGMKQKLAIAGTLLQQSDTLFLDEPTAMLDDDATKQLWELLRILWQDQTVLIVEHKVEHIWQYVDRVILMNENGEIIHDGTPVEILSQYEDILTSYGVWHPNAWRNAPSSSVRPNPKVKHHLQLEDVVTKRAKKTLYHLSSLTIQSGEWVVLTGNNGTGKTTLLESMMQMTPYDGHMYYNNQTLSTIKQVARHLYLVYQNPELQFIQNSVYDELFIHYAHQDRESAHNQTLKMLDLLQLTHVQNHHPFELSMGQKRRLSVATALSTNAEMILLDEPTFGLDSHNTFQLIELFQERVNAGQTIIMVTHDQNIISRYPTRHLHVDNGKLYEVG